MFPILIGGEPMGVIPPEERLTQYQLVGEVTAHQGYYGYGV